MTKQKKVPPEMFSTGGFFSQEQLKKLGVPEDSRTPHNPPKKATKTKRKTK